MHTIMGDVALYMGYRIQGAGFMWRAGRVPVTNSAASAARARARVPAYEEL